MVGLFGILDRRRFDGLNLFESFGDRFHCFFNGMLIFCNGFVNFLCNLYLIHLSCFVSYCLLNQILNIQFASFLNVHCQN